MGVCVCGGDSGVGVCRWVWIFYITIVFFSNDRSKGNWCIIYSARLCWIKKPNFSHQIFRLSLRTVTAVIRLYMCSTELKRSVCIAYKLQATSFYLGEIVQKWADVQFSFINKGSMYYIKHVSNMCD